jgi:hypothetical protein
MYMLHAMIVAFFSVFMLSILGYALKRKKDSFVSRLIVSTLTTIIYGLILCFFFWSSASGFYGPTPYLLAIVVGAIIAGLSAGIELDVDDFQFLSIAPAVLVIVGYLAYAGFVLFVSSDMFQSSGRAALIGDVKVVNNLKEVIEPADTKHINQVSKQIATTFAQAALSQLKLKDGVIPGSRYEIGEPTKEFVAMQYWWVFPLEFQSYFKWNQDRQVPGFIRVSAEDPSADPQVVQVDKNGKEIHIKYLNSACFDFQAERYLRYNGYKNMILDDWTFEVDDNWRPYYTISVLQRQYGFSGYKTTGIVLLDLQTGDIKYYKIDEVPKWVDRSIPLESVIDPNVKSWGEYFNCSYWYAFWHNDKSQKPTDGWYLTYNKDSSQWFTGFTSMNDGDNALTGFMVTDARTGKSTFLKASGVTENIANDAARAMWANFPGYEPTEMVPYNLYGILTYVIPMEANEQFAGISLVSIDVNIKASGKTLEEALRNYRDAITVAGSRGIAPQSGKPKTVQIKGKIEGVGLPLTSSKSAIFTFKLQGIGKVFQVGYSDTNPESIMMNVGDTVTITFDDTTEVAVSVTSFDITSVVLEKGSVTQAKYIENQKTVDAETTRITDQKKLDDLISSDQIKTIDPKALQDFLDSQKK